MILDNNLLLSEGFEALYIFSVVATTNSSS